MKVTSDFGGLAFNWENKERVDITITVTTPDEHGQMITAQNFYSNSKSVKDISVVTPRRLQKLKGDVLLLSFQIIGVIKPL